jgi:hypothetical protein
VKVYGADMGVFENGKYEAVAKQLLAAATQGQVNNPQLTAALARGAAFESETFKDGKASGEVGSVIPPMLFLVAFYIAMILLSNQMLNSTLEEKENRVTEMILTTLIRRYWAASLDHYSAVAGWRAGMEGSLWRKSSQHAARSLRPTQAYPRSCIDAGLCVKERKGVELDLDRSGTWRVLLSAVTLKP